MRDASLLIEPHVGLLRKIRDTPLSKKLRRRAFLCGLVGDVLRAFLTKFKMRTLAVRLRPGATGTIDSVLLIELQQRARAAHHTHFAPGKLRRYQGRLRAASDFADRFDFGWSGLQSGLRLRRTFR